jgi:hypothetical protein
VGWLVNQSRASPGGGIEGTWLLEQVTGAGHHGQVAIAAQLRPSATVEVRHHLIVPAGDEQRGRGHGGKPGAGGVRTARRSHVLEGSDLYFVMITTP